MGNRNNHHILQQASDFITLCYAETGFDEAVPGRIAEIRDEIADTGTYTHTGLELVYGAKLAWRNSNRCIGRLFWDTLTVTDARHVRSTEEMASYLFQHLEQGTNRGRVRPMITVFAPATENNEGPRIWNHQLIRYAGYEGADGAVLGDPASLLFTRLCQQLDWTGSYTPYDILPLVISGSGDKPQWFPIPDHLALEVPLEHPEYSAFAELGLRWYAVPFVSDMTLEIGGIHYPAAPFNGWYMGTEIGSRNLADEARYRQLPEVARAIGIETTRNSSLWKDRALVELNIAVLHSYRKHGVSIVDHHTASQQFMTFEQNEQACGREATGRWSWLVPPLSPSQSPLFHKRFVDEVRSPQFLYREDLRP
ncbi:nitric oxide synthase oxygenase [Paenibacillus sp. PL2-23]|uniref:nitric oxide synthase oxygenase n=1 Tax=Paenibacillus sp. PL2-23 TaxID=2100729 RepID=UPI0030FC0D2B